MRTERLRTCRRFASRRCIAAPSEPRAAERDERADAVRDGEARERDLGVAVAGEQAAARIAHAVERRRSRRRASTTSEQRALRARRADIDAAAAAGRVRDAELGDLGAQEREHGVRVVAGVLVDREDLEAQAEPAQVLGGAPHGDPDGLLVVTERQDDGDVEPRSSRTSARRIAATVPPWMLDSSHESSDDSSRDCNGLDTVSRRSGPTIERCGAKRRLRGVPMSVSYAAGGPRQRASRGVPRTAAARARRRRMRRGRDRSPRASARGSSGRTRRAAGELAQAADRGGDDRHAGGERLERDRSACPRCGRSRSDARRDDDDARLAQQLVAPARCRPRRGTSAPACGRRRVRARARSGPSPAITRRAGVRTCGERGERDVDALDRHEARGDERSIGGSACGARAERARSARGRGPSAGRSRVVEPAREARRGVARDRAELLADERRAARRGACSAWSAGASRSQPAQRVDVAAVGDRERAACARGSAASADGTSQCAMIASHARARAATAAASRARERARRRRAARSGRARARSGAPPR